ncbi:VOC family protein [Microbacterium sp.]|uniref:VOC family protein n=1 Tax=Microbacterium sp. TaxID=51671 RepID=UPI00263526BC|nr:VOC family protein [Microbacterium sp.]
MTNTQQKIIPNLWFDRNAEEAGEYYTSVFQGATSIVGAHYPAELPTWQSDFAGKVLTVDLVIDGYLMTLINAGDEFRPNPSISFMLNFDPLFFGGDVDAARARLNEVWAGLTDGGQVLMALVEYPFSPRYGWVQDRYGVNWQLMLTDPEGDPRPFVIPQLMFAGPADAGSVMFGEFQLAGQWFSMMDSAAEQCGWLADRYGVSWQIVPENMGELMARPGAYDRMLEMKKLVIADF